jgi:N-acyl homoserine lactone hydrolase
VTAIAKLYVLLCGYEILPRSVCLRGGGNRFVESVPVSAYLLETRQGFVLFDTGINADLIRDPALRHQHFTKNGWEPPVVWPQHELLPQLRQIGIEPKDVRHVVLSHAHLDHTGNLRHFRHAKVWMQKNEYDFAFEGPAHPGVVRGDLDDPDLDWSFVDGDHEVMPGFTLLSTPGHTPGHQSALISLPRSGRALLVGDVGDWMANFENEILPGEASDDAAALESIRKINRICREEDALMFVCHDPDLIQNQKLAPDYYD